MPLLVNVEFLEDFRVSCCHLDRDYENVHDHVSENVSGMCLIHDCVNDCDLYHSLLRHFGNESVYGDDLDHESVHDRAHFHDKIRAYDHVYDHARAHESVNVNLLWDDCLALVQEHAQIYCRLIL